MFDLEKAYDLTQRHVILMDVNEAGLERRMFKFIQSFFKLRSFKVKFIEVLSDTKVQTEGMSQGSVTQLPNENSFQKQLIHG